jgi:hypothetical protein
MTTLFLALLALAVLGWLVQRARRTPGPRTDPSEQIDRDVLEQAEEEVRGLGTFTTPETAEDELPDWGPGTPRP